jgi:FkbM family methyltransferase
MSLKNRFADKLYLLNLYIKGFDKFYLYKFLDFWVLRFLFNDRTYNLDGEQFYVDNYNLFMITYTEIYDNKLYDIPINNPQVIIDMGANTGLACHRYKKIYPDAKIMAYEPCAESYYILKRNVNHIKNVVSVNSAISNFDGYISMKYIENNLCNEIKQGNDIQCISIKTLVNEYIDLIKMDVEKSEYIILDTIIIEKLYNNIGNMVIEFHDTDKRDLIFYLFTLSKYYNITIRYTDFNSKTTVVWALQK